MPYCDAALTDKAAQSALSTAKLDRKYGTFLPRTPRALPDWLEASRLSADSEQR